MAKMIYSLKINETIYFRDQIELSTFFFSFFSNIDIRIKQAELEYQLGREELNLLSILEEIQSLKHILEERDSDQQQSENTLFR